MLLLETNLASRWRESGSPKLLESPPDFPGISPNFPGSSRTTSPEVLSLWNLTRKFRKPLRLDRKYTTLWNLTSNPEGPRKIPIRGPRMGRWIRGRWICVFGAPRFSVQRPPNPYFEGFRSDLGQKSGAPQTQIQRPRIQRPILGPLIPRLPRKFPRLPQKFPGLPRDAPRTPGGQPLSLGSQVSPFLWEARHPLLTHEHFLCSV